MNKPTSHYRPRHGFNQHPHTPQTPRPTTSRKKRGATIFSAGSLVQLCGLVCFVFGLPGMIGGVLLLVIGGRMARKWQCERCGTKLAEKSVIVCPGCRCTFTN